MLRNQVSESMMEALMRNDVDAIRRLLGSGEDLNATYKTTGLTPILLAVGLCSAETIQVLLANGASMSDRDKLGNGPLARAAHGNNIPVMKLLLQRGCRVGDLNEDGNTPLHLAALNGSDSAARLLLAHGGQADQANNYGITPRHIARGDPQRRVPSLM
jgi:ankyrin repeat protein